MGTALVHFQRLHRMQLLDAKQCIYGLELRLCILLWLYILKGMFPAEHEATGS